MSFAPGLLRGTPDLLQSRGVFLLVGAAIGLDLAGQGLSFYTSRASASARHTLICSGAVPPGVTLLATQSGSANTGVLQAGGFIRSRASARHTLKCHFAGHANGLLQVGFAGTLSSGKSRCHFAGNTGLWVQAISASLQANGLLDQVWLKAHESRASASAPDLLRGSLVPNFKARAGSLISDFCEAHSDLLRGSPAWCLFAGNTGLWVQAAACWIRSGSLISGFCEAHSDLLRGSPAWCLFAGNTGLWVQAIGLLDQVWLINLGLLRGTL